jgi:hypothetical protein
MSREDAVTVDGLIKFGELTAPEIAKQVGVELHYVLNRALQMNAPFSVRRPRAEILADFKRDIEVMAGKFSRQVAQDRRDEPL